ncbi:MAG TPA: hemerythrin domain-containing protein [Burkholderiales bacterium]|nr:hemerythrin domain-containing protein [Burkholderiales bacterium]
MTPRFDEPLELLEACHARIETQLAMLERLVAHVAQHGCDIEAREAARFIMRYFDTAGVHHHRDENEDLFPLLRRKAAELECPEVSAVINELEGDHETMDLQWSRLRERLDALTHSSDALLAAGDIAGFAWLNRRHMEKEAALVLPFAKEALDGQERAALGERMAARRKS